MAGAGRGAGGQKAQPSGPDNEKMLYATHCVVFFIDHFPAYLINVSL
jgi:hypothetical protein